MFLSSKRFLLALASGGVLLQLAACNTNTTLQVIDTGLLGALAGIAYYIARKA